MYGTAHANPKLGSNGRFMDVAFNAHAKINIELQSTLNNNPLFIKRGASKYKLGDKVMQIKNNYDKNVFNGDIGFISDINLENNTLKVDFDGKSVDYTYQKLEELVLYNASKKSYLYWSY